MVEDAGTDTVYAHDQLTGGIRADDAGIRFHPVGRVVVALFGGEERDTGLHGIQAKILVFRQGYFSSFQEKGISNAHITGAMTIDLFHHDPEVVQFKLIGSELICRIHK